MAYYDALIAAWNNPTQPPPGVTGAPLTAGMTTQQKLDTVNAWTITGVVPTSFYTTGDQLLNCINWPEFNAMTVVQQQSNILALCSVPGQILGGSSNTSHMAPGMFLQYFSAAGPTITALKALAQATVTPWWEANHYTSPISQSDLDAAGLS